MNARVSRAVPLERYIVPGRVRGEHRLHRRRLLAAAFRRGDDRSGCGPRASGLSTASCRPKILTSCRVSAFDTATSLVPVYLVLRTAGEDLLLAPVRDSTEGIAVDEFLKRLFVRPFAGDQVRGTVADVFPQRRTGVSVCGFHALMTARNFSSKSCCLPSITW